MTQDTQTRLSDRQRQVIEAEVGETSRQWIASFNRGDAEACVAGYADQAVMNAKPMGRYVGRAAILDFWKPFIESGASDLAYANVQLDVRDPRTVLLSADWRMNVGHGIITKEKWVKQQDGQWRLEEDDFEVESSFQ